MAFSDNVEKLLRTVESSNALNAKAEKQQSMNTETPTGWTAGVILEGSEGTITTKPKAEGDVSWEDELKLWGFDPAKYEVVEPVRVSTWQVLTKENDEYVEKQLWAYRANIRTKNTAYASLDFDSLCAPVKGYKSKRTKQSGDSAFVVPIGDWQIGKPDGDGLEATIERVKDSQEQLVNRVIQLRDSGHKLGTMVLASLGDLGEGCVGHYEQQTFGVELDRRDQNKVVRRLVRNLLMELAPMFDDVIVAAVAGNHGENRQNGKSFTSTNDNDDVAIFEQVAEALSMSNDFDHVRWLLPKHELSVSFNVGNKVIGLAHGHQAKNQDIARWWQSQTLANRPVAHADLLLTGHFHHFRMAEVAKNRWWLQVPAMDGGSLWFEEMAGSGNTQGQVSFVLNDSGWHELEVL